MSVIESFRVAWDALLANKARAILTMLGIIIGIGAVVGMLSIGNGLRAFFQGEFDKLGVGVFNIVPQVDSSELEQNLTPRLTFDDAQFIALPGAAPAVADVVVQYDTTGVISAGRDLFFYDITGITPNHFQVVDNDLLAGRYYTQDDEEALSRVTVLGGSVAADLFANTSDAIGKRVTINGVNFEVIGIVNIDASALDQGFSGPNDAAYIPYATARNRLFRNQLSDQVDVGQITVRAHSREEVQVAIDQVTELLRFQHQLSTEDPNDFTINNPEQQAQQADVTIRGLSAFLIVIASISLVVGGIGIMNIMLVSVTQRTREIGLRKAVGARRRDILLQFLIEAVVLCLLGGILGVMFGYVLSFAGTYVLENIFRAEGSTAVVTLSSIILATTVSTVIGVSFGFFPALRAARLNPIQALRSE
ncbi:MAG: FtsX-like permease family protein [Chloroflexi bacterium AL-W]|nr:FtsX-like permease family protein [Chloroflexi bacterium AL-N1]NOK69095.1 FtsX-like permease family protein [Chloroflexi bacterium AL-N10]NOK77078.1 FtsX-like permease family protein [Chloroflexi bacterium AL-N5]NOK83723.1 FtsX-like permease family protein [Chloroflexi bacterium AL-W]NOK90933.1 FtsX-like permease family protein [Chloroflexi bacterium AL-N15]